MRTITYEQLSEGKDAATWVLSKASTVLTLGFTWFFGVVFVIFAIILYQITREAFWGIYNMIAMFFLGFFMFFTGAWLTTDRRFIIDKINEILIIEQIWLGNFIRNVCHIPFKEISHLSTIRIWLVEYFSLELRVYKIHDSTRGLKRKSFWIVRAGSIQDKMVKDLGRWLSKGIKCQFYENE
jgi:hypothetical protein